MGDRRGGKLDGLVCLFNTGCTFYEVPTPPHGSHLSTAMVLWIFNLSTHFQQSSYHYVLQCHQSAGEQSIRYATLRRSTDLLAFWRGQDSREKVCILTVVLWMDNSHALQCPISSAFCLWFLSGAFVLFVLVVLWGRWRPHKSPTTLDRTRQWKPGRGRSTGALCTACRML